MNKSAKITASVAIIAFAFLMDDAIFYLFQGNEAKSLPYLATVTLWSAACTLLWHLWRQKKESLIEPRLVTLASFDRPNLQEGICNNIRANLSIHGDGVAVVGCKMDSLLVKWVIDNEYIPKADLERAVHDGICQAGRSMFDWHRVAPSRNHPDRALSPEALGYAMKHGVITDDEIASIRFDHGETAERYIASAEGLFERVMRQLSDGTAFFDLSTLDNVDNCHDVCC